MNFYFTFGFNSPHNGKYVCINADSWTCAHNKIMQRYGHYQYQYDEEEFSKVLRQYSNLKLLEEL